jgi:ClpP class serine protease
VTWLLREDIAREMRIIARNAKPELREKFVSGPAAGPRRSIARSAGDVTEIAIEGVLTKHPDFLAWLLGVGNTSYLDIQDELASAAADPSTTRVVLAIDSPGGHVSGLFETLAALETFPKPITVRASLAASAAYAIAASAGRIEAITPASEFGSIGVAVTFLHDEDLIDITNTASPAKRPDVTTEQGKAVIRRELDALHELLIGSIASGRTRAGRKTTAAEVNSDFGRGGMFIAGEARQRGLIDAIGTPSKHRAGSDLEMVDRLLKVTADAKAGKIPQRIGEPDAAYHKRLVRIATGKEDANPEPLRRTTNVRADGRDIGDLVADALGLPPAREPSTPLQDLFASDLGGEG